MKCFLHNVRLVFGSMNSTLDVVGHICKLSTYTAKWVVETRAIPPH